MSLTFSHIPSTLDVCLTVFASWAAAYVVVQKQIAFATERCCTLPSCLDVVLWDEHQLYRVSTCAVSCSGMLSRKSSSIRQFARESVTRISTNSRFNVDRLWSVTVIPFRCCQLLAEGTGSGRALAPFREIQLHVCRRNNIAAETREGCNEHFTIKTKCTTSRCSVSSHGSLASCSIPQFNPTSLSQLCSTLVLLVCVSSRRLMLLRSSCARFGV